MTTFAGRQTQGLSNEKIIQTTPGILAARTQKENIMTQEGNHMEQNFCQSCGMPLNDGVKGTNADGSINDDYCIYCYKDGKFTQDMTMEQMIEHCAQFTDEMNKQTGWNLTQEQAKEQMRKFFPNLKRWKE